MAFLAGMRHAVAWLNHRNDLASPNHDPRSSAARSSTRLTAIMSAGSVRLLRRSVRSGSLALAFLASSFALPSGETAGVEHPAVPPVAAAYALEAAVNGFVRPVPQSAVVADNAMHVEGVLALGKPATAVIVGVTTADTLNLRQGPGTGYGVISKLGKGTQLEVIGEGDGWYRVATAGGTVGWIIDDFFSVGSKSAPSSPAASMTASVNSDRVNLRSGPGVAYSSFGTMASGTALTVLARNSDWYKVRSPRGTIGWVATSLVNISGDAARRVPVTSEAPVLTAATVSSSWVWPARGQFTSGFGWRGRAFHDGIDIANAKWSPIVAARAGTVIQAGWCGGYGYCVRVSHGDGLVTEYAHLASHPPVWAGQAVSAGRQIGYMGMTYGRGGYATGVHLHFTVKRYGTAVNPLAYLP